MKLDKIINVKEAKSEAYNKIIDSYEELLNKYVDDYNNSLIAEEFKKFVEFAKPDGLTISEEVDKSIDQKYVRQIRIEKLQKEIERIKKLKDDFMNC